MTQIDADMYTKSSQQAFEILNNILDVTFDKAYFETTVDREKKKHITQILFIMEYIITKKGTSIKRMIGLYTISNAIKFPSFRNKVTLMRNIS